MNLIPAMDLIDGKCVRLYQGNWQEQEYFQQSPVEWAKANEGAGVTRLHMVDLDGAFTGNTKNAEILKAVRKAVAIPIQIGGGIRSVEQAEKLIAEGFDVILGTMLYKDPTATAQLIKKYPDALVASVDCKEGFITLEGWTISTSVSGIEFVQYLSRMGFKRIVYTDIAKDGTLSGANLKELSEIMNLRSSESLKSNTTFQLIASGGIGCLEDLKTLKALGVEEAIVGKALLSGAFSLDQALEVCNAN